MPSSNLVLAPTILHLAWEVKPRVVLDVGPGRGKYATLLREYVDPDLEVHAVEPERRYLTRRLLAQYDAVFEMDVCRMPQEQLDHYDLVLMVDVIEHMEKRDALALLDRVHGYVVVCTPRDWFQNPECEEFPSECHRSSWTTEDFGDRLEHDASQLGAVLVRLRPCDARTYLRDRWEQAARTDARAAISPGNDAYEASGWTAAARLAEVITPSPDVTLLEIGCGDGRVTRHLCFNYGRVIATDISPTMLELCRRTLAGRTNFDLVLAEGNGAPLPAQITDAYSDSVLMHNRKDDVREILAWVGRSLPRGGRLVFQLPVYETGPREARDWTDVAAWTARELEDALRAAGLRPERIVVCPGEMTVQRDMPAGHADLHVAVR